MKRHRRRAIVAACAAAAATALITVSTPAAHADVPGPYFATSSNASDPHIIPCVNPSNNVNGFCLYTSRDMGQSFAYTGNPYPMEETRVFFSPNGVTGWVDMGRAFHENTIEVANGGWVPNNAFHLWAPAAVKSGSFYYLYVPDVSNKNNTGQPEHPHQFADRGRSVNQSLRSIHLSGHGHRARIHERPRCRDRW